MFQLSPTEKQEVVTNCDHLAKLKFSKTLPFVFTEHGAIQAANVLNSEQAIDMGVFVVRAFIRSREVIASNKELAKRLDELETKADLIDVKHDNFEHNTRLQLKQVFEAIRELSTPPEPAKKRRIGFAPFDDEQSTKSKAAKATKGKA